MSHWVSTLKHAKVSLTALGKQKNATTEASSSSQEGNLGSKLFRDLHHIAKQHQGAKILFNFQIAAISLYFILHGSKLNNTLVCNSLRQDLF